MIIGIPKEIKNHEYRVGLTVASAREIVNEGHEVIVESNAAEGIGLSDRDYEMVGARIAKTSKEVFEKADLIVKVKEPQKEECLMLNQGQVLFTYLHLAADRQQTRLLADSGCTAIAYETVTDSHGGLPLLSPMSEVAGRMSIQAGSYCLEKGQGGRGVLLGGVPGVAPAGVLVIGGGVVGTSAVRMAVGKEAQVTVLDKSVNRLRELDREFGARLNTIYSTQDSLEHYLTRADLVIGAVLIPGAAAPKLVSSDMLKKMKKGAVVVDVAIDQGGCFASSRPTTFDEPTYIQDGIVHYCVTNMPGAVARTSTFALNNATLPYVLQIANKGYKQALLEDDNFLNGLNVHNSHITIEAVAETFAMQFTPAKQALEC